MIHHQFLVKQRRTADHLRFIYPVLLPCMSQVINYQTITLSWKRFDMQAFFHYNPVAIELCEMVEAFDQYGKRKK